MAIIYRLEVKNAQHENTCVNSGVYQSDCGQGCSWGSLLSGTWIDDEFHPVPKNDMKLSIYKTKNGFDEFWFHGFVFGFDSVNALYRWFGDIKNHDCSEVQIGVYECPDNDTVFGTFQAVFKAERSNRIDVLEILTNGE